MSTACSGSFLNPLNGNKNGEVNNEFREVNGALPGLSGSLSFLSVVRPWPCMSALPPDAVCLEIGKRRGDLLLPRSRGFLFSDSRDGDGNANVDGELSRELENIPIFGDRVLCE